MNIPPVLQDLVIWQPQRMMLTLCPGKVSSDFLIGHVRYMRCFNDASWLSRSIEHD